MKEGTLDVDAGLVSIMPESFVKKHGGTVEISGNHILLPAFDKPKRITLRVRRSWRGPFRVSRKVPAGERIYIGDPCYCFDNSSVGDSAWSQLLDYYWSKPKEMKKFAAWTDTGGDGGFPVTILWEDLKATD